MNRSQVYGELYALACADLIRAARQQRGVTQADMARRLGMHRPVYSRIEAGRHAPSLSTLQRIAEGIGCHPLDLVPEGAVREASDNHAYDTTSGRTLSGRPFARVTGASGAEPVRSA